MWPRCIKAGITSMITLSRGRRGSYARPARACAERVLARAHSGWEADDVAKRKDWGRNKQRQTDKQRNNVDINRKVSIYFCIYLSINLCLFVYLSICLSTCPSSFHLSIYICIHTCISIARERKKPSEMHPPPRQAPPPSSFSLKRR